MNRALSIIFATLALSLGTPAHAQNAIDVGVIKDDDVKIVQKLLYPKADKLELGAHLAMMPFDAFTFTPAMAFTVAKHMREDLGIEGVLMGGYSLKNTRYNELEGPAYGISPDAYRFLGSAMVDAQYSPIYAKMNVAGQRIYHHDVFVTGGLGVTIEEAMQPDNSLALAPTLGLGIGARIFTGGGYALRLQLRDDILREKRAKTVDTQGWFIKQNVSVVLGLSKLSK
jgi:outer membrane beta-barrel protein